jgi:hypothetical protein
MNVIMISFWSTRAHRLVPTLLLFVALPLATLSLGGCGSLLVGATATVGVAAVQDDTWISTQLTAEILFDIDIFAINYNMETINGVIYVVGIAQNQAEIDKLIEHARRIKFVKKVVSHVLLKDDPRREPGP